jgi:hypothetical protein
MAGKVNGLWLFDFRKREFGLLAPYLERVGVKLNVVPARKLCLNPLQVPYGTDPREYAPNIADALKRVLKLPQRAEKLLHSTILQLQAEFGVRKGSQRYPTLFDLREAVAADKRANPQARQAIVDSLDPVLLSIGDVLCYWYGWTTRELAKRHLVFEFGGISDTDKDLLVNTLILSEFMSRISQGVSNPGMDLFICVDEAARIIGSSEHSIADLISVVRGSGIGLDLSLQSADVTRSVLSNVPNRFVGRVTSHTDLEVVGSSLGLTQEQRRWITRHLVPGTFVGQLGQGAWREPFVLRIPPMRLKRPPASGASYDQSLDSLRVSRQVPRLNPR